MSELAMAAMAPVGAVFTFIALVTGSAWGKPMWGTWWVWDARLTSELVLLFLYLGVIALYNSFEDRRTAGRAAGILVLVGVVNIPIIHYSVQWWNTLHQGSSDFGRTIDPSMRYPLFWSVFGYLFFFITLTLMRLRNLIINQERLRPWVATLVNKERCIPNLAGILCDGRLRVLRVAVGHRHPGFFIWHHYSYRLASSPAAG